jgi:6-phosphogluconolactonase
MHKSFVKALNSSDTFKIAFSGGSLPSFLTELSRSFLAAGIPPQWNKWHIILADERVVPSTHEDSNMKALLDSFLQDIPIPKHQIYGIDEELLEESTEKIATEYHNKVFSPLLNQEDSQERNILLDCALLGLGPDGHTCSLFPDHELLNEGDLYIAGIDDSPKLPPKRITLTLKTLNDHVRDIIFVGAGASKSPILDGIFETVTFEKNSTLNTDQRDCNVILKDVKDCYPCGMVRPKHGNLYYITDSEGAELLDIKPSSICSCSCL